MAAGNALIGALKVSLGIDSASFETGLKKAQSSLGKFSKITGISLAAAAAGGVAVASAMGLLVLRTANAADALSKASQKAGIATESLSRLKYAADFSDVSLEQLTGGLGKLGKAMVDAATNKGGQASIAFRALGVSVTDANGKMRATDDVFRDVAEQLSRVEEGAVKTTLAQRLFGKSGADLLPLLNEGADGLQRFADASDRTGNTLSASTGKAAEAFNDKMAEVGKTIDGIALKMMEAALPALQSLADLLASPDFAAAAQILADNVISGLTQIIEFIVKAINYLDQLERKALMEKAKRGLALTLGGKRQPGTPGAGKNTVHSVDSLYSGMLGDDGQIKLLDSPEDEASTKTTTLTIDLDSLATASAKAKEALDPFQARIAELSSVLTATADPFSQMKLDLVDLQTMFDNGRISAEQFGGAVQKTIAGATASFAGLAGEALGALSQIFDGNKELAVASAIVNGIGSIAKTLETYGVTPWGIAAAGVAAVTAAANVASILSTSQSSKSMPGTGTPSAAVSAPAQQPRSAVNITLNGQSYGRDQIRDLLDQIKDVVGDGYDFRIT